MSKFKNINEFDVVGPEGVKFIVVKDGNFARCDLSSLLKKINEEYPAAVNASISKLDEAQNAAITDLNKKIEKLTTEVESLKLVVAQLKDTTQIVEASATEEATAEKKTAKKAKKTAE